jgi:DNA-binding NtrC family response regulator
MPRPRSRRAPRLFVVSPPPPDVFLASDFPAHFLSIVPVFFRPTTRPPTTAIPPHTRMSETSETDPPIRVLIVASEELLVRACEKILLDEGYTVHTALTAADGLREARRGSPEFVLADLEVDGGDRLALLEEIREAAPQARVVMMTGLAAVEESVEAIRLGAYDYIPKPFTATQLRIVVGRAAHETTEDRDRVREWERVRERYGLHNVVATGPAMRQVVETVQRVAGTDAPVFISGPCGSGKELLARAIHAQSRRGGRPFLSVHCAALPEHLLETELFGYEAGIFTPPYVKLARGRPELASGGTFFVDEVTEMEPPLQRKLLKAVRTRTVVRVGNEHETPIDVRWIAGTTRDPEQAVRDGVLLPELLEALGEVSIRLPPLKERSEDVPALAEHFLRRCAAEYGLGDARFSPEALRVLSAQPWGGNVRELENIVERAASLAAPGREVGVAELPW